MIDRDEIASPYVLAGYDYWLGKLRAISGATTTESDLLPARRDFDPLIEIPRLAPRIMLMDVLQKPLDFRYRLVGSALRRHMAQNWTGQRLSEIPFQRIGSTVWRNNELATLERRPILARPPYIGPHKDFLYIESIILPLAGDGHHVDMLMFFVDFIGNNRVA